MDLRKVGFEDRRWRKLAQDCVQWWALMLPMLKLEVLLP
jgi:hypothetical protein